MSLLLSLLARPLFPDSVSSTLLSFPPFVPLSDIFPVRPGSPRAGLFRLLHAVSEFLAEWFSPAAVFVACLSYALFRLEPLSFELHEEHQLQISS